MSNSKQIIEMVSTPFGNYFAATSSNIKNNLLHLKSPIVDVIRNTYLMGKMPWRIYEEDLDKDLLKFNGIIRKISKQNPNFLLPDFLIQNGIAIKSSTLETILSTDGLNTFCELNIKKEEETTKKLKKYTNVFSSDDAIKKEEIEFNYFWNVFGQMVLAHISYPIKIAQNSECNCCNDYTGFILGKNMAFFYVNETMENNGHGPFRIDEYQIISLKKLTTDEIKTKINQNPLLEVTELNICKIDETYGNSDINLGFQKIATKYSKNKKYMDHEKQYLKS